MDKIPINITVEKYYHLLSISIHCKVKNGHIFLFNADATTVSSIIHSSHEDRNFRLSPFKFPVKKRRQS